MTGAPTAPPRRARPPRDALAENARDRSRRRRDEPVSLPFKAR